jgi:hypothetical protein
MRVGQVLIDAGDTSGIETVPLLAMIEAYGLLPHDEHEM